jgi:uncharacterized protein YndB with AHSA1/START domain
LAEAALDQPARRALPAPRISFELPDHHPELDSRHAQAATNPALYDLKGDALRADFLVLVRLNLWRDPRKGALRPNDPKDPIAWVLLLEDAQRAWEVGGYSHVTRSALRIPRVRFTMTQPPPGEDAFRVGIAITRVFDAPRERVWREWTQPEAFADWFGGRDGDVSLSTVSMDVRPGGPWRLTMLAGEERHEIRWNGVYREVVEPERLVFRVSDQPEDDRYELIVVVLTDLGDGRTEMAFEQRGLMPPDAYEAARSGWTTFFDRVDERLAG